MLKTDIILASVGHRSMMLLKIKGLARDSSASCFLPITGLPFSFTIHRLR
ncbi:hypothetical protein ABEX25_20925 [Paenibacillus thiaminolyticus]